MNNDKIKSDPIDYYFGDLNKYPSMCQYKLNEKLRLINDNMETFIGILSHQAEAWPLYVVEWQDVLQSGKRVHKMSKLTGKTQHENLLISNNISTNMRLVEQHLGALLPIYNHQQIGVMIENCKFNMAIHYKVQEKYKALSKATHYDYVVRFLAGHKKTIIELNNEIAAANLKLVIKFAKEYQHVGVPLGDLIQEGNIGLMRAIEKFDVSKGLKFTTYAVYWIKQGFLKVIKQNNRLIRIPTHIQETLSRIAKNRAVLEETGSEVTMARLAMEEGMNEEELETLYNVCMEPISLETVVTGEQNKQLKDFIPDTTVDLEADLDARSLSDEITKALDLHLLPVEKDVIIYRYGLFGQTIHTLEEIASMMNKSRERIRQLEASAKKKLGDLAVNLKGYA